MDIDLSRLPLHLILWLETVSACSLLLACHVGASGIPCLPRGFAQPYKSVKAGHIAAH